MDKQDADYMPPLQSQVCAAASTWATQVRTTPSLSMRLRIDAQISVAKLPFASCRTRQKTVPTATMGISTGHHMVIIARAGPIARINACHE